jgi:hypothetical protein
MASDVRIPSKYRLRVKQRLAVVHYVKAHGIKPIRSIDDCRQNPTLDRSRCRRYRETAKT